MSKPITIDNFNMGGLADSKWSGVKYALYKMLGWDAHSKPGVLKVAQKLTKVSSTTVDELCLNGIDCSDSNKYYFSSESGKIWKIASNGTLSLVYTITAEIGEVKILGAREYNGYIYIATEKRLHRIAVSKTSDWSANIVLNWADLNLDQAEIGLTGSTYALPSSISELAVGVQTFTPVFFKVEGIAVYVATKGTGNWTLTVHDPANNVIASKQILNASLPSSGKVIFAFTAPYEVVPNTDYHYHLVSSDATGTIVAGTSNDLETSQGRIYTVSDNEFKPMLEQNLVLFIGDKTRVHQVDNGTFTASPKQYIPEPLRIKSLGKIGTDLLFGTIINSSIAKTSIYRWNTYSDSFTNSDEIDEVGINAFIPGDNTVFVQAGLSGNIYAYNGETLELYRKVPGDYSPTAYGYTYPNAVANLNGVVLFGFSNGLGNPADQGVYALARHSRNYPYILDLPYPISERDTVGDVSTFVLTNLQIGCLLVSGFDLYVAWKRTVIGTPNTYVCGIDKLDYSNKLNGSYFESLVALLARDSRITIPKFVVAYASLPENTDITIEYSKNYAAYVPTDGKNDEDSNIIYAEPSDEYNTLQLKVTATAVNNTAPEIESATFYVE